MNRIVFVEKINPSHITNGLNMNSSNIYYAKSLVYTTYSYMQASL